MEEMKIQWHPGFIAAVDLELAANRDDLVYEKEYNLNVKPLEIDLLVIKKNRDIQIENEIGKLFRGHNIMEYKSPQDRMDIDVFYKTQGYGCLYKAYGKMVDCRKADDITISIVREAKPVGLFRYFRSNGIDITNPYPGIYYLTGKVQFLTQIIVTRELAQENHAWLKALSNRMKKQDMKNLLDQIRSLNKKYDQELADAVLTVSTSANQKMTEELKGDENMKTLMALLKPEFDKAVEEAVEKAVEEAVEETKRSEGKAVRQKEMRAVAKMYQLGFGIEKIAQVMEYPEATVMEWLGVSAEV